MVCTKVYTLLIMIIEGISVQSSSFRSTENGKVVMDSTINISNEGNVLHNSLLLNKVGAMKMQLKHKREKRHAMKKNCLGVCKRSLCPWTEVWDIDNDRIPKYIPRAICNNYPVFKDNKYTYMEDWPVACVCTKKLISAVPQIYTKDSHVKRQKLKNREFISKSRRHKHLKDKNHQRHNKSERYKNFQVIPPVLTPFQFLPQYKK